MLRPLASRHIEYRARNDADMANMMPIRPGTWTRGIGDSAHAWSDATTPRTDRPVRFCWTRKSARNHPWPVAVLRFA